MIIVTGGAGFIGSNLVHRLNSIGETDILAVDHLASPADRKHANLEGTRTSAYMDKHDFRAALASAYFNHTPIRAIFHQGACVDTLSDDSRSMLDNNVTFSKDLLRFAVDRGIPLVYASTAAVYGTSSTFTETPADECPANLYGFSKMAFDDHVRALPWNGTSSVVGLRYFNVYGPREGHKGRMASLVHQFATQLRDTGTLRLFAGSGGLPDGEQSRDFIHVDDIVDLNLYFAGLLPHRPAAHLRAILNAGSGRARTINQLAAILIAHFGPGKLDYIPFPRDLTNSYQHFTQANLEALRNTGYTAPFLTLEQGIAKTLANDPALLLANDPALLKGTASAMP